MTNDKHKWQDAFRRVRRPAGEMVSLDADSFYAEGEESPHRERSVEENLDLFRRMRAGEFPDGAHVLRAKIDMSSKELKLRDPTMYRIRHAHHHRTGPLRREQRRRRNASDGPTATRAVRRQGDGIRCVGARDRKPHNDRRRLHL